MTLIDYAKYLLSVCGRRFTHLYRRHYLDSTPALPSLSALLSYLRTQTATIYGYLQTRFAGDPTSGIPSITPTQPLTFANLLPNLQKLATRKIDAGASTQIPDGMSLVRLLCDTTAASAVTELIDTNTGWTMSDRDIFATFPNVTKITIGSKIINSYLANGKTNLTKVSLPNCETINGVSGKVILYNIAGEEEMTFPKLKEIVFVGGGFGKFNQCKKLYFPELLTLKGIGNNSVFCDFPLLEELYMPKFEGNTNALGHLPSLITNNPQLNKVVLGKIKYYSSSGGGGNDIRYFRSCPNLIYLEIEDGVNVSLYLNYWNPTNVLADTETKLPTFLTNFRQYLFLRLADRTATTALTLTLSSAVYTALTTETSTLAELGITTLTDKEQAAGITLATAYNTWLDTYRAAINWNITNAG